jgi:geranylgeranyl diphosphate synthase type I
VLVASSTRGDPERPGAWRRRGPTAGMAAVILGEPTLRVLWKFLSRFAPIHPEGVEVEIMTTQSQVKGKPRQARVGHHQAGHAVSRVAPQVLHRTTIENAVDHYLAAIEQELRDVLGYHRSPAIDFWQMLYYHMGWECLDQPHAVRGKRLRPLLTVLCTSAAGGDRYVALPFAASVELLHNFTLVHDDIQDASSLRRGRATVWAKWGEAQAINTGDALFTFAHLAVQRAVHLPHATRLAALALLDQTCVDLSKGQYLDMAFATRPTVTVEEYLAMIDGKAASLLATAADLGALVAGVAAAECTRYCAFARHLGLMFQIRDDILGIWGSPATTGKLVGTDLSLRKKTLPVIYGLEHSPAFREAFQTTHAGAADMATLTRLLEVSGARQYAEAREQWHATQALQHLAAVQLQDGEASRVLHA